MENRLAELHSKLGSRKNASDAYLEALKHYPNNMDALRGLKACYLAMGEQKRASQIQAQIKRVSSENDQ